MENKTAYEWFNLLKPEVRDKAIANAIKGNGIKEKFESISKALGGTFVWNKTPEGHKYWSDVNANTSKYIHIPTDPIIESVTSKFLQRSQVGQEKYKSTLKDNTSDNYLKHLQEELMDAVNYLEVLIQQKSDITELTKLIDDDEELGKKIREIYG